MHPSDTEKVIVIWIFLAICLWILFWMFQGVFSIRVWGPDRVDDVVTGRPSQQRDGAIGAPTFAMTTMTLVPKRSQRQRGTALLSETSKRQPPTVLLVTPLHSS